ncbi:MAG: hypothetical protein K0R28_2488 [Paenibacillus sp.]|nr:hypothetical protein [Paenibacillus sp.]
MLTLFKSAQKYAVPLPMCCSKSQVILEGVARLFSYAYHFDVM